MTGEERSRPRQAGDGRPLGIRPRLGILPTAVLLIMSLGYVLERGCISFIGGVCLITWCCAMVNRFFFLIFSSVVGWGGLCYSIYGDSFICNVCDACVVMEPAKKMGVCSCMCVDLSLLPWCICP